jgi:hypothetical protein
LPLVIPRWRGHDVADWDALLVPNNDGERELNRATAAILNYMPVIGVPALTPDTAGDAWCRIAIHQALFGTLFSDDQTGKPFFLTKSDVFRHIGMETEGTSQAFGEFCESLLQPAKRQAESDSPLFVANGNRSLLQILGISKGGEQPATSTN